MPEVGGFAWDLSGGSNWEMSVYIRRAYAANEPLTDIMGTTFLGKNSTDAGVGRERIPEIGEIPWPNGKERRLENIRDAQLISDVPPLGSPKIFDYLPVNQKVPFFP